MFCPSCGVALSQQLKYCNRCGAQLITTKKAPVIKSPEKRLDEYLDGLFWISVFGLGLIAGGTALMKRLNLDNWLIVAYLVLSSLVFLVNFGLSLREIFRMTRISREAADAAQLDPDQSSVNELNPMRAQVISESVPSVTENTTRELESIVKGKTSP
jgi:hypothetical protein